MSSSFSQNNSHIDTILKNSSSLQLDLVLMWSMKKCVSILSIANIRTLSSTRILRVNFNLTLIFQCKTLINNYEPNDNPFYNKTEDEWYQTYNKQQQQSYREITFFLHKYYIKYNKIIIIL